MATEQRNDLPENDEIAGGADRLIVESPTPTGLIVIKSLAPEPGLLQAARSALMTAARRRQCNLGED